MSGASKSAVASHRARKVRAGFARVEVSVCKEDAGLVRQVAAALADPARQALMRRLVGQGLGGTPAGQSLKALLAAAPLDGIDLDRRSDVGRDVDL